MLACNDAIALFKHYHICKKFNYLTAMRVDFGNVCGPTGAKRRLVGLSVFRILVNSVPILQFLSMETKAASQAGCRCNADWGRKREMISKAGDL